MSSEFVRRKRILGFYLFDRTKDGLLKQGDFDQFAQDVANFLELTSDTKEREAVVRTFASLWDIYGKPADQNNDGVISVDDFLSSYEAFLKLPNARELNDQVNMKLFDALDLNHDGKVDQREYAAFLAPLKVRGDDIKECFKRMDRNSDGFISREEFVQDQWEYWNGEDPAAPGNWALGLP